MATAGKKTIALCMSGGGFRAGALSRLNELGVLSQVRCFSSVSGGSITNGVLATRWTELGEPNASGVFEKLHETVIAPTEAFCADDLRTDVLLWDRINPINWMDLMRSDYSITDRLAVAYGDRLGLDVPLSSLPGEPDFVVCAANLGNGGSWEFHADRMGDFRTIRDHGSPIGVDELKVSEAVAASSAYPVTFPPLMVDLPGVDAGPVTLTDGGVYDNLGLEPVTNISSDDEDGPEYERVLVSDAGAPFPEKEDPGVGVGARLNRSLGCIWNQAGAVRKRWLIARYRRGRSGDRVLLLDHQPHRVSLERLVVRTTLPCLAHLGPPEGPSSAPRQCRKVLGYRKNVGRPHQRHRPLRRQRRTPNDPTRRRFRWVRGYTSRSSIDANREQSLLTVARSFWSS